MTELLKETHPFSKNYTEAHIRSMISWYLLNRSIEAGHSPATELLKSISENMLNLFKRFHEDEELVKMALSQLLIIKRETEVI